MKLKQNLNAQNTEYSATCPMQSVDAIRRCDELEAELVRLRADAKRLDWLNDQMMQASNDTWRAAGLATSNVTNLRDAIDYTMTVG